MAIRQQDASSIILWEGVPKTQSSRMVDGAVLVVDDDDDDDDDNDDAF